MICKLKNNIKHKRTKHHIYFINTCTYSKNT